MCNNIIDNNDVEMNKYNNVISSNHEVINDEMALAINDLIFNIILFSNLIMTNI